MRLQHWLDDLSFRFSWKKFWYGLLVVLFLLPVLAYVGLWYISN